MRREREKKRQTRGKKGRIMGRKHIKWRMSKKRSEKKKTKKEGRKEGRKEGGSHKKGRKGG